MDRGELGRYKTTIAKGKQVKAFVPNSLPPDPPIDLRGPLQQTLESASIALGRLDGITAILPEPFFFLYPYVRKEALLSSQIEGTRSSLSELLLFELEDDPGAPNDDVTEVSNHIAALEHGTDRLSDDFPLCNRLIREVHEILLSSGRGKNKAPGEFRRSQNWIGGTGPGDAVFVPPPHEDVENCMADLERFLHAEEDGIPTLIRAGIAHFQFETIHPFLDGNGRVGRLLILLMLVNAGILQMPILYLSLYFKRHHREYYRLLNETRLTGDWETWLAFFLEGIRTTSDEVVSTSRELLKLFDKNRELIRANSKSTHSDQTVHNELCATPILSLSRVADRTDLHYTTVDSAMKRLIELGIVREITGKRRGRVFAYNQYLEILIEGTEPL